MEGAIHCLPDEILRQIFSHLPFDELWRASYVCTRWRGIIKGDTSLWRRHRVEFYDRFDSRELLLRVNAMPPLETLHFCFTNSSSAMMISWPKVCVTIPETWETRFPVFIAENYVVEYSPGKETRFPVFTAVNYVVKYSLGKDVSSYLSWVQLKALKRLHLFCSRPMLLCGNLTDGEVKTLRERKLRSLWDYCCSWDRESGSPRREESSNSPQEAALVVIDKKASHDLEDAGGNGSSSQLARCPDLEVVSVFCQMDGDNLEKLCLLGPVRVLRLEECKVAGLSFLRHCVSSLEKLVIRDCRDLQETELVHLSRLNRLRILELPNTSFKLSVVCTYIENLPQLKSLRMPF